MRFVFSRRFFILFAIGIVPLSLSWSFPWVRYGVWAFDLLLFVLAFVDYFISRKLPPELTIRREFDKRFAIGDRSEVKLHIENASEKNFYLRIKDEFPPEMVLSEKREARFAIDAQSIAEFSYFLTPPRRGLYTA